MSNKLFADRAFVTINGYEAMFLKTASVRRNQNLSRADHMTRNGRSSGYKYGNMHVQISLGMDIAKDKPQFDTALNKSAEINVVFECGSERYTAKGLAESDMSMNGSVGDAGKEFNYEALDLVNENGESVNVDISL